MSGVGEIELNESRADTSLRIFVDEEPSCDQAIVAGRYRAWLAGNAKCRTGAP